MAKPIEREEHIMRALIAEGWRGGGGVCSPGVLRDLARRGERLRLRWENECSYPWAASEDDNGLTPYGRETERQERALRELAAKCGLTLHLQTDPRGAPVYVRPAPLPIPANAYNSVAHCLYYR